jgi:Fe-S-cluster containining protein
VQLDCLSCGACCYGPEEYVAVAGPDADRMSARTRGRFVVERRDRRFLRMVHGHCAALHARQGHFSCRIYGERPTPCRIVEPGGRECLDARRRRGVDGAAS